MSNQAIERLGHELTQRGHVADCCGACGRRTVPRLLLAPSFEREALRAAQRTAGSNPSVELAVRLPSDWVRTSTKALGCATPAHLDHRRIGTAKP